MNGLFTHSCRVLIPPKHIQHSASVWETAAKLRMGSCGYIFGYVFSKVGSCFKDSFGTSPHSFQVSGFNPVETY